MKRRTLFALPLAAMAQSPARRVKKLQIRILSTMLADSGIGEWGFAAMAARGRANRVRRFIGLL